jgi:hypothetical protein
MLLIDPQTLKRERMTRDVDSLEGQMKKVLKTKMSDSKKWHHYRRILDSYLGTVNNMNGPIPISYEVEEEEKRKRGENKLETDGRALLSEGRKIDKSWMKALRRREGNMERVLEDFAKEMKASESGRSPVGSPTAGSSRKRTLNMQTPPLKDRLRKVRSAPGYMKWKTLH